MDIAQKIKSYRKHLGMTQEALASKAGINEKYYGRIERGESCPTMDCIGKLCDAMEIDMAELLLMENEKENRKRNEILKALHERKSIRVFTQEKIGQEEKESILNAALQAPSAGCQLLYTILDITDQKKKERLAELCDHQPFIADAKLVLVFCADCRKWLSFYREAGLEPRDPGAGDLLLAVEDALIAAQNAVTAAESLGIGSCYIGDVMENAEEMKALLELPRYVYPACMVVFGYPTDQQKERKKPVRFQLSDMVCENSYRDKSSQEIRRMFSERTGMQSYDAWMEAFWKRKYESDFSNEMNRSMEVYLKDFLNKR